MLKLIEDQTGMRFHHVLPPKASVSVAIPPLPVKPALERLFGPGAGVIFRYRKGVSTVPTTLEVPVEVWILGNIREDGAEISSNATVAISQKQENLKANVMRESKASDSTGHDVELVYHLTEMAQGGDPGTRMQALSELGQRGKAAEAEALIALTAALNDRDPSVRGSALQGLASLAGAGATAQLWQALQDPDPGVRVLAVESVAQGQEGKALLESALSDPDETVRVIAKERLEHSANRSPGQL